MLGEQGSADQLHMAGVSVLSECMSVGGVRRYASAADLSCSIPWFGLCGSMRIVGFESPCQAAAATRVCCCMLRVTCLHAVCFVGAKESVLVRPGVLLTGCGSGASKAGGA